MNKLHEIVDHLADSKTLDKVVDTAKNPLDRVTIRLDSLPPGAGAQTLPTGEIILNEETAEDGLDAADASKLVHELSHALHDENYLDRENERQAFQAQVQFLVEKGYSSEEIEDLLLPTFEEYKEPKDAKELLQSMIEKSKKKLMASLTRRAHKHTLTFTPPEKAIIDQVKAVAERLGITAYLAGGLVRDRLLGKDNDDLDFVTNKGSEVLAKALAKRYGLPDPVKLDRSGATMVHVGDKNIDIIDAEKVFTPLNNENQTLEKGQEGEMSIFLDDAFRRDLTINSLMYNIHTGELLDPTGKGLADLENRVIRTIIDPNLKYRVHAPDMLRALRFYSTGDGFKFAPGMLEAMKANADKVTPRDKGGDISARRIERELRKAYKDPQQWAKMKSALAEVGLYDYIGKQIEDVDRDRKGNIDYGFDKAKTASAEFPPVPETCSCGKGKPQFKAHTTNFPPNTPATWWDCPACKTTGLALFEDDRAKNRPKKKVEEDLDELIDEHERLVDVLNSPSHKDDKEEAKKQQKELDKFKKQKKEAQALEDSFIQGPDVQIDPGLQNEIKDAVNDLKKADPAFFKGVGKIVALTGGPFGQVSSNDPTTVNLNLNKIKQEVQRQLGSQYNPSNSEHKKVFDEAVKRSIVETIAHETGHVRDFSPEKGTFPGGEGSAESLQSKMMNQLQYDKPINFNPTASKTIRPFTKKATEEVATVAVVDDNNALLMAPRTDDGKWTLPGGHLEEGEDPAQGAIRELLEETAIEVGEEDLQYLGTKTVSKPDGGNVEVHSFLAVSNEEADSSDDPDAELEEWTRVSTDEGLPVEIKDNLHNGDNDVTLQFMGLQSKTATDFAGRDIPNDPVFFTTMLHQDTKPNYAGGEVLKEKEYKRKRKIDQSKEPKKNER